MRRSLRFLPSLLLAAWFAGCNGPSPLDLIGVDPPNERVAIRLENDTGTPFCGTSRIVIARLTAFDLDVNLQDESIVLSAGTTGTANMELVNGDTLRVLADFGFGQSASSAIRIRVPRANSSNPRTVTFCAGSITFHFW